MSGTKGNTYLQAIIPQLEHLARLLCLDGMCETEFLLSTDLRRAQTRTEKQNKQKKIENQRQRQQLFFYSHAVFYVLN
jgi:hypothetical protein